MNTRNPNHAKHESPTCEPSGEPPLLRHVEERAGERRHAVFPPEVLGEWRFHGILGPAAIRANTPGPSCITPGQNAFSLNELLVALAVIGILASLQFVAASTPKSRSSLSICMNNLRQLTSAWTLFAQDNQGKLPGNMDGGDAQILANTNATWCVGWLDFQNGAPSYANTNLGLLSASQLGPYVAPDLRIFKCPSDTSVSLFGSLPYARVRSVSMNTYMGNRAFSYTSGYRQFKNLADIIKPTPAGAFLFLDEREDSINDACFQIDMTGFDPRQPLAFVTVDFPADYHEGGANLSFVDGHVETWHWRDPHTTPLHRRGQLLSLGISTPNNPDVERIQLAASRKISNPTR